MYEGWRADLIKCLAHLEAVIDFGEDERLEEEVTETGTVTYTCAGTATLDQHRTLPAEGRIRC